MLISDTESSFYYGQVHKSYLTDFYQQKTFQYLLMWSERAEEKEKQEKVKILHRFSD